MTTITNSWRQQARSILRAFMPTAVTKRTLKAVSVHRVNRATQEHEYLMEDGSIQTLRADQVVWANKEPA